MQRGNEKEEVRRRSGSFSKLEKKKERYLLKKGKNGAVKKASAHGLHRFILFIEPAAAPLPFLENHYHFLSVLN